MNNQLKGVVHVTGEHDVGKTTFALECGAQPNRICFFDDDLKGRTTVDELRGANVQFGAYHDLAEIARGKKLLEFHRACLGIIKNIEPGEFDAIIWDTWTRFATSCGTYAKANPNEFRAPGSWAKMGRIKGAEMAKEGTLYEAGIIGQLARLAPTVILITHLKDQYLNNAKTGKEIPAHGRTLTRVARTRIWLRQNPEGRPVPIGLFLKRFDKKVVTESGLRTIAVVPRKITPNEDEHSLWDTVWQYWENPIGDRIPTAGEVPNEYELSILDGTLTSEQKRTFHLMLQAGLVEKEDKALFIQQEPETETPLAATLKSMAAEGKSVEEIAVIANKPPQVVRAMIAKQT